MALDAGTLAQLTEAVSKFVDERLIPLEDQVATEDKIPETVIAEMAELGLFGLTIPAKYGGLGLNTEEECRIVMELGRAAPAFRSVIGTNNGIGSQGLVLHGTNAQRGYYLPKLASGEITGSFALTEPDAGSDSAAISLRAIADGDDFLLSGTKRYITNATRAQLFTVFARTNPEERGSRGISAILVDASTPGISLGAPTKRWGSRAPMSATSFSKSAECRNRI